MAKARQSSSVRATGQTRLVEVMYDSEDPKFAAQFANTLVSEFVEQSQEMRWKASQRTGEGLEAHLNEMKANLEKSEANLQAYARSSGLTMTGKRKRYRRPTEGTAGRVGQGAGRSRRQASQVRGSEDQARGNSAGDDRRSHAARVSPQIDGFAAPTRRTQCDTDAGASQSAARASADHPDADGHGAAAYERHARALATTSPRQRDAKNCCNSRSSNSRRQSRISPTK